MTEIQAIVFGIMYIVAALLFCLQFTFSTCISNLLLC